MFKIRIEYAIIWAFFLLVRISLKRECLNIQLKLNNRSSNLPLGGEGGGEMMHREMKYNFV